MTAGLPWVRLDTNIPHHDKTLRLIDHKGGKPALAAYLLSIAWAGGTGTDGHIPRYALRAIHATPADATLLEQVGMWEPDPDGDGWWIHNYAQRQETSDATDERRERARAAALKRWHGTPSLDARRNARRNATGMPDA